MNAAKTHAPASAKADKAPAPTGAGGASAQPAAVNPVWSLLATQVQTKLTVSSPDDPYEREADQMADRVMRMPDPRPAGDSFASDRWLSAGSLAVQRKCSACEDEAKKGKQEDKKKDEEDQQPDLSVQRACKPCEEEGHEDKTIQRQAVSGRPPRPADALVHRALASPGRPLEPDHRDYFEQRFNADFGRVRIHTGGDAARAANAVHARAFTAGPNVAFAHGEYSPASSAGRRLIAHELTHVAQQGHAPALGQTRGADATGGGPAVAVAAIATPGLQRDPKPGDDPDLAQELQDARDAAGEDWNQDDDVMARAHGARLSLLYDYVPQPTFTTRDDLDDYIDPIEEAAETEIGTLSYPEATVNASDMMDWVPEGFPLEWAARIQRRLSFGIDIAGLAKEVLAARESLATSAKALADDIYEHGLPIPLDDPSRLASFTLRLSDANATNSKALADYTKESIAYIKLKFIAGFAVSWELAVENFADAVRDGDVIPNTADYQDWVDNKEAMLSGLMDRARERMAMTEEEVKQLQTDTVTLTDAAVAIGMYSGLVSIFAILDGWTQAADLFEEALADADKKVAGADGGDRIILALKWGWANSYFSGAAAEWVQNLIAHGPAILLEIGLILVGGMIPGVNIAVAIYLALTVARDVIHMIGEVAQAISDCTQATSVAQLQRASMRLARALVNGGIFILIVLVTEGVGKAASRLRKEAAELRAADKTLTEEAAQKKAMEKLSAEEKAALEGGPAKLAKKFQEAIGDACTLGSIICGTKLPKDVEKEAGAYPTAHGVPKPAGPFDVKKSALSGVSRSPETLRKIVKDNPSTHTPEFLQALAETKKKNAAKDWPEDATGAKWQVHHIKPVNMGGDNTPSNLVPLPPATHLLYNAWWGKIYQGFKTRFTDAEWNDIYLKSTKNVPDTAVPQNPVK